MKYRVYMEQDEDGVFVATARLCWLRFPGPNAHGSDRQHPGRHRRLPPSIVEEVVEVVGDEIAGGVRQRDLTGIS